MNERLFTNNGAGLYGHAGETHKTACPNSNNAFGHSDDCPCKRAKPAPPRTPNRRDPEDTTPDPWDQADAIHEHMREEVIFDD